MEIIRTRDQARHRRRPVARRLGRSVAVHRARRAPRHRGVREVQARHATRSRACTSRCRASATSATTCARSSTPRARSSRSPTSTRSRPSARSASSAPRSSPLDDIFEVDVRRVRARARSAPALNDTTIPRIKARDRRRRREQPARRAPPRRRPPRARHPLRARLRDQRGRPRQRRAGGDAATTPSKSREKTLKIYDTIYEICRAQQEDAARRPTRSPTSWSKRSSPPRRSAERQEPSTASSASRRDAASMRRPPAAAGPTSASSSRKACSSWRIASAIASFALSAMACTRNAAVCSRSSSTRSARL